MSRLASSRIPIALLDRHLRGDPVPAPLGAVGARRVSTSVSLVVCPFLFPQEPTQSSLDREERGEVEMGMLNELPGILCTERIFRCLTPLLSSHLCVCSLGSTPSHTPPLSHRRESRCPSYFSSEGVCSPMSTRKWTGFVPSPEPDATASPPHPSLYQYGARIADKLDSVPSPGSSFLR